MIGTASRRDVRRWYEYLRAKSVLTKMESVTRISGMNSRDKIDEIKKILRMRAKKCPNEFDKESLGILFALLVRDIRDVARIL